MRPHYRLRRIRVQRRPRAVLPSRPRPGLHGWRDAGAGRRHRGAGGLSYMFGEPIVSPIQLVDCPISW